MLVCYDSVTLSALPTGAPAYAGYQDGNWPNVGAVRARFPKAHVIAIAISAMTDADCLDVENGDATPAQAPAWVARQLDRGIYRPIVYSSQSEMPAVLAALAADHIARNKVRVWAAHYGEGLHICSPTTCNSPFTADGTQWAGHPGGGSPGPYDISALADDFFDPAPQPVQEDDMQPPVIIRCSDPKHSAATLVLEQGVVVSLSQPTDLTQYGADALHRTVSPGTFDQYAKACQ